MTIPGILEEKLSAALKAVLGADLPADFRATVAPSADLRFGDYQSNAAMVLAKRCRTDPARSPSRWSTRRGEDDVCSLEIAGPGFINFRIKPEFTPRACLPCWRTNGWAWSRCGTPKRS